MNGRFSSWRQVRASGHGRNRAAFWAKLGYPNLKKGTAVFVRNCQLRKAAKQAASQDDERRQRELQSNIDALRRK